MFSFAFVDVMRHLGARSVKTVRNDSASAG